MKRILCFGDSNTWGFVPAAAARYSEDIRWTGRVQKELGCNYHIIEEGLNGRTTAWDDPLRDYMNGLTYAGPCVISHFPLDLIIIMLGTNDLKQRFHLNSWAVAEGIRQILREIGKCAQITGESIPEILLISPIFVGDGITQSPYADEFEAQRTCEISRQLGKDIYRISQETHTHFMDAALYAAPSAKDSIHMEPEGHAALAEAVVKKIYEIFKDQ